MSCIPKQIPKTGCFNFGIKISKPSFLRACIAAPIEKIYNYTGITHGMAVAVGMALIARAGEKQGVTAPGTADRIIKLCEKYGLPTDTEVAFADMAQAAMGDKKTAGSKINLVMLKQIGESFITPLPLDELESFITI